MLGGQDLAAPSSRGLQPASSALGAAEAQHGVLSTTMITPMCAAAASATRRSRNACAPGSICPCCGSSSDHGTSVRTTFACSARACAIVLSACAGSTARRRPGCSPPRAASRRPLPACSRWASPAAGAPASTHNASTSAAAALWTRSCIHHTIVAGTSARAGSAPASRLRGDAANVDLAANRDRRVRPDRHGHRDRQARPSRRVSSATVFTSTTSIADAGARTPRGRRARGAHRARAGAAPLEPVAQPVHRRDLFVRARPAQLRADAQAVRLGSQRHRLLDRAVAADPDLRQRRHAAAPAGGARRAR